VARRSRRTIKGVGLISAKGVGKVLELEGGSLVQVQTRRRGSMGSSKGVSKNRSHGSSENNRSNKGSTTNSKRKQGTI
jgi:hypothetical protein